MYIQRCRNWSIQYFVLSRDIKRYLFSEIWCLLACRGHTQSISLTKSVHFRFMSVIPSYFVRKSALFGRSNDSEWSIFDKTRNLEKVEGCLAYYDISGPRYSGQMIGTEVRLKRAQMWAGWDRRWTAHRALDVIASWDNIGLRYGSCDMTVRW